MLTLLPPLSALGFLVAGSLPTEARHSSHTPVEKVAEDRLILPVPDDIRSSGEHGRVVIEGRISADRGFTNPIVVASSRSDRIDAHVLSLVGEVKNGRELAAQGYVKFRITALVYNWAGLDRIHEYSCDQAVLDSDWRRKAFQTDELEYSPLVTSLLLGAMSGRSEFAFVRDPKRLRVAWWRAIDACRTAGHRGFVEALVQQGNAR